MGPEHIRVVQDYGFYGSTVRVHSSTTVVDGSNHYAVLFFCAAFHHDYFLLKGYAKISR